MFTVKKYAKDADADAIVLIDSADGLLTLNAADYATPAHGSIVVSGAAGAWNIAYPIEAEATSELDAATGLLFEDKAFIGGKPVLVGYSKLNIRTGIVKEI